LDGYIRVSRVAGREGESFISPEVQREQIEAWAVLRRATIEEWHVDLDVSGARARRPGLDAAIDRVERKQTNGIVVAKLDRLARSLPVAFDAIQRIERAGGRLISVDEGIDPATVNGRMMRGLLLLLAEWYRDQVRESWTVARERAVKRGVPISSTVPTGYRRGDDGRLEPDPVWGPVISEVFARRAQGRSWADLARWMNDQKVPVQYASGRREARWTGHTVSRLVAGRVYLGEVRHGQFLNPEAHDPLVTPAVWHAAQSARSVQAPRVGGDGALLAGLVRCSGCGYGMYRSTGRGAGGTVMTGYRCRGGGSGGECPDRAYAYAEPLEDLVVSVFLRHLADLQAGGRPEDDALDELVEEIEAAEHALKVFRDDPRVIAALGPDGFADGLRERARRVDDARAQLALRRSSMGGMPDVMELGSLWPDLDVRARHRLLAAAIDCVVVAGRGELSADRVRVCWLGLAPDDLPARGRRGYGLRPIPFDGLPTETRVQVAEDVAEDA
jgi:DNA invertase Pin-like site-specific DNA recombinase